MSCESDEKMLHEVEQEWYAMQGFKTDIKCHFYYDESNNCRKFWVRLNITVRQSRQSGVARSTCPD